MNLGILLAVLTIASSTSLAQVTASQRHVVILQPSIDSLWGSYMFAVENRSQKPEHGRFAIPLPKETIDFRPEEGLEPQDIVLADGQNLSHVEISKDFPPGSTLISLSFQVPASSGSASLNFDFSYDVTEFLVMAAQGRLNLQSDGMQFYPGKAMAGHSYDTLRADNVTNAKKLHVHISGIMEGRSRFWYLGAVFGAILVLCVCTATWLSLKKTPHRAQGGYVGV